MRISVPAGVNTTWTSAGIPPSPPDAISHPGLRDGRRGQSEGEDLRLLHVGTIGIGGSCRAVAAEKRGLVDW